MTNMAPLPDRNDVDPRETQLSRRSNAPAVSLWVILIMIVILGALAYVVSALI